MTDDGIAATSVGVSAASLFAEAVQDLIPNRLRGRVTALYYVVVAMGGMTQGPVVIGFMNDFLFAAPMAIGKSPALAALLIIPSHRCCFSRPQ